MPNPIDLTGQRFGRLVAVECVGSKNKLRMWKCICDCGNIVVTNTHSLRCGNSTSCGCSRKGINSTHKQSGSRLYKIRSGIIQRTTNPKNPDFPDYGGRGIAVCDEWLHSFTAFSDWAVSNGYRDDLTIDRIDNNGNYSPENCRWITRKEQASNRRSNHILEYHGERETIEEWCKRTGLKRATLTSRLKRGWSIERAIETPLKTA